MIVLGIDPGLRGAIARIEGDDVRVRDLPTKQLDSGKTAVHPEELASLLGLWSQSSRLKDSVAFVEWAQASSQMGVSSAFRYGEGFGLVRGVLAQLCVPTVLVTAAKWKRHMGLTRKGEGNFSPSDKTPALLKALALYPHMRSQVYLGKHEGRAEAVLIAHYGCEQLEGELAVSAKHRATPLPEVEF